MKYTLKLENNLLNLTFQGDLIGGFDSLELMDAINDKINQGVTKAIVNMGEVRYMNSSGIGILITIFTKFKNRNGNVVVSNASDQIIKLLTITKLDTVIKMYATMEEAQMAV
ncbi:MAG: STAS domain-containing protein [Cytophagales bacterium]